MLDLAGKVAVVTGASSGIGAEIARVFALQGASVVLAGRNAGRGEAVLQEIKQNNKSKTGFCFFKQTDVTVEQDLSDLVNFTCSHFDTLDILVNNAGVFLQAELEEISEKLLDDSFATNLRSAILLTRYALPHLKMSKGNIINIASLVGQRPMGNAYAYAATKAGLENFTKLAAKNYAHMQIRVNAICPGTIQTPALAMVSDIGKGVPYGRVGQTRDVANAALFLASDEADFITGCTITVDGGQSL
ncbi:MAG: SDR family oxidoreductase [Coriobacteriales bacterium]|jgi:NAD(P)-dependent dehydrogenase (short-subunit alcohol dehydrogenase family)|nr:SDR family oxidoreductase [Coriobacteriales bacterium]